MQNRPMAKKRLGKSILSVAAAVACTLEPSFCPNQTHERELTRVCSKSKNWNLQEALFFVFLGEKWWYAKEASLCEKNGQMEEALRVYQMQGDYSRLAELYQRKGDIPNAMRYYELLGDASEPLSRREFYCQALKLAMGTGSSKKGYPEYCQEGLVSGK